MSVLVDCRDARTILSFLPSKAQPGSRADRLLCKLRDCEEIPPATETELIDKLANALASLITRPTEPRGDSLILEALHDYRDWVREDVEPLIQRAIEEVGV